MPDKLRFGILGAARIAGKAMVPAIRASNNATVVAVAARDAGRAAHFASEHGLERSYGSYAELLEDPDVDAVYNPLPNDEHAPWTLRALAAGKHVLVEKPYTMNAREARQIAAAARENNLCVLEGFMWRFHPQVAVVREALAAGAIGELRVIRASFSFVLDRPDDFRWLGPKGGGALYDLGCYCTSAARLFAGREPRAAYAVATRNESGADLTTTAVLDFGSHLTAHFDVSMATDRRQRLELAGSNGTIIMEPPFGPGLNDVTVTINGEPQLVKAADAYRLMIEHFTRAARGEEPLQYGPEDAVKQMAVLDAITESSQEGRVVYVEPG